MSEMAMFRQLTSYVPLSSFRLADDPANPMPRHLASNWQKAESLVSRSLN